MIKLTRDQTEAAQKNPSGIECQADGSEKRFVIVDADVHARLRMKTDLYEQETRQAIAQSIADMEAGMGVPLEEADKQMRENLGFPPRQD